MEILWGEFVKDKGGRCANPNGVPPKNSEKSHVDDRLIGVKIKWDVQLAGEEAMKEYGNAVISKIRATS